MNILVSNAPLFYKIEYPNVPQIEFGIDDANAPRLITNVVSSTL